MRLWCIQCRTLKSHYCCNPRQHLDLPDQLPVIQLFVSCAESCLWIRPSLPDCCGQWIDGQNLSLFKSTELMKTLFALRIDKARVTCKQLGVCFAVFNEIIRWIQPSLAIFTVYSKVAWHMHKFTPFYEKDIQELSRFINIPIGTNGTLHAIQTKDPNHVALLRCPVGVTETSVGQPFHHGILMNRRFISHSGQEDDDDSSRNGWLSTIESNSW